MRKECDALLVDPLICMPADQRSVFVDNTGDSAVWASSFFTPLRLGEVRSGKLWRVTAFGNIDGDLPSGDVTGLFSAFVGPIDIHGAGVGNFTMNQADPQYTTGWFVQFLVGCKITREEARDREIKFTAGGIFTIGGNTFTFSPAEYTTGTISGDLTPPDPPQEDALQVGFALATDNENTFNIACNMASVEALN